MSTLAPALQAFFTERLISQRQASPHTVAAYRDTLPAAGRLRSPGRAARQPAELDIADLDAAHDRRRSSATWRTNAA